MQATTQRAGPSTLKPRSRIHTPQAIRPPSHILLSQDPAYNNLLSPAAFSDTESLFSTTSATSTARRKRRRKALQQGSKAAELLRALSKQYPASTVGPLCCVLGLACKALLEAAALYRFNHQTVSEGLETRRIFCHVSNTPLSNWYHEQDTLQHPPGIGLHAWLIAKFISKLSRSDMLAAVCSEDPNSLSTWTGLAALSDVLVYAAIYIPVVFLCSRTQPSRTRMLIILTLLLHPLTLLPSGGVLGTDLVSGALALGVLGALQSGWDLLAVLQLVIGVVYNQNMGYLACPTAAYIINKSVQRRDAHLLLSSLFIGMSTLAACLAPFATTSDPAPFHLISPAISWSTLQDSSISTLITGFLISASMLSILRAPRTSLLPYAFAHMTCIQGLGNSTSMALSAPLILLGATAEPGSNDQVFALLASISPQLTSFTNLSQQSILLGLTSLWSILFIPRPFQNSKQWLLWFAISGQTALSTSGLRIMNFRAHSVVCTVLMGCLHVWALLRLVLEFWAASTVADRRKA